MKTVVFTRPALLSNDGRGGVPEQMKQNTLQKPSAGRLRRITPGIMWFIPSRPQIVSQRDALGRASVSIVLTIKVFRQTGDISLSDLPPQMYSSKGRPHPSHQRSPSARVCNISLDELFVIGMPG